MLRKKVAEGELIILLVLGLWEGAGVAEKEYIFLKAFSVFHCNYIKQMRCGVFFTKLLLFVLLKKF